MQGACAKVKKRCVDERAAKDMRADSCRAGWSRSFKKIPFDDDARARADPCPSRLSGPNRRNHRQGSTQGAVHRFALRISHFVFPGLAPSRLGVVKSCGSGRRLQRHQPAASPRRRPDNASHRSCSSFVHTIPHLGLAPVSSTQFLTSFSLQCHPHSSSPRPHSSITVPDGPILRPCIVLKCFCTRSKRRSVEPGYVQLIVVVAEHSALDVHRVCHGDVLGIHSHGQREV